MSTAVAMARRLLVEGESEAAVWSDSQSGVQSLSQPRVHTLFVLEIRTTSPRPFDGTGSLTSTPCATSYAMQASTRVTGPEPPEGEDALDVRPQQPAGAG